MVADRNHKDSGSATMFKTRKTHQGDTATGSAIKGHPALDQASPERSPGAPTARGDAPKQHQ